MILVKFNPFSTCAGRSNRPKMDWKNCFAALKMDWRKLPEFNVNSPFEAAQNEYAFASDSNIYNIFFLLLSEELLP